MCGCVERSGCKAEGVSSGERVDGVVWWLEDDEPDEEMTNEVALQKGAARLYPEMQAILGGG